MALSGSKQQYCYNDSRCRCTTSCTIVEQLISVVILPAINASISLLRDSILNYPTQRLQNAQSKYSKKYTFRKLAIAMTWWETRFQTFWSNFRTFEPITFICFGFFAAKINAADSSSPNTSVEKFSRCFFKKLLQKICKIKSTRILSLNSGQITTLRGFTLA